MLNNQRHNFFIKIKKCIFWKICNNIKISQSDRSNILFYQFLVLNQVSVIREKSLQNVGECIFEH